MNLEKKITTSFFAILLCTVSVHAMEQQKHDVFNNNESESEIWKERSNNKEVSKAFADLLDENSNRIVFKSPPQDLESGVRQLGMLFKGAIYQKASLVDDEQIDVKETHVAFMPQGMTVNNAEMPSHRIFNFWMIKAYKRVVERNEKVKSLVDYVVQELANTVNEDNKEQCIELIQRKLPRIVADHVGKELANTYGWFDKDGLLEKTIIEERGYNQLYRIDSLRVAIANYNYSIQIWNTKTKAIEKELIGHYGCITALASNKNNNILATASLDQTNRIWDLKTGECLHTINVGCSHFGPLRFINDTTLISCPREEMKTYDIASEQCLKTLTQPGKRQGYQTIEELIIPEDQTFVAATGESLTVWDLNTPDKATRLTGHRSLIRSLILLKNKQFVSGSYDGRLKLWDLSGNCLSTLEGHEGWVRDVIMLDDATIASCSNDRTIKIWDLQTGKCKKTLTGHDGYVTELKKISDIFMASASLGENQEPEQYEHRQKVKIWNIKTGKCIRTFGGYSEFQGHLAVFPGVLITTNGGQLRFIDRPTFEQTINFLAKHGKEKLKQVTDKTTGSCTLS